MSPFHIDELTELKSPIANEWPDVMELLKNEYKLTKENYEFLSTIIEYLIVSVHTIRYF